MVSSREPLILAIDQGTQSARALVFDVYGTLYAKARIPIEPYFSEHPGWAEQQPDVYWQAICDACQQVMAELGENQSRLVGVTLTTQRGTVINLDAKYQPLRPAMTWLDQRRVGKTPPLPMMWRAAFRLVGATDLVWYLQAQAESNWIAQNQPEIWAKTRWFVLLSGYLTHKLTGNLVDSIGAQVGFIPFEAKDMNWAGPRSWKWPALSIAQEQLPPLVATGQPLGEITLQASKETGLPVGLPVIAAAADKACEVLGSGVIGLHQAGLSYGTTASINLTSPRYWEVSPQLPPFPAAIPNEYNMEIQIYRGYWMVSWFKQQFGHREQRIADERGVPPEVLFDELIQTIEPGSRGLILQPYWTPGIRNPGPEAKGAIIGFGDVHTRAHIYRAILEGVAYALREGLEHLETRGRTKVTELRVAGGGSQSDTAMQITADIFGRPAIRPHTHETSGLGAAICAAVGLGLHRDTDAAVKAMVREERTFLPDPKHQATYEALYHKVYKRLYQRLQPLYEEIAAITGYPPPMDAE